MKTVPLAQLVKRDNLVKVLVLLDPTLTGCASESLWATRLGRDLYRIENIPFFAPDMALGDIIEAKMGVKGLQFRRSVKASGSRTVQVAFWPLSSWTRSTASCAGLKKPEREWSVGAPTALHSTSRKEALGRRW